jgi:hypothetical protein
VLGRKGTLQKTKWLGKQIYLKMRLLNTFSLAKKLHLVAAMLLAADVGATNLQSRGKKN